MMENNEAQRNIFFEQIAQKCMDPRMREDDSNRCERLHDMSGVLDGKTGKALEQAFLQGMIPHHAGAVSMVRVLLKDDTVKPEFKKFANDIINAQAIEIDMMKEWLKNY